VIADTSPAYKEAGHDLGQKRERKEIFAEEEKTPL